VVLDLFLDHLIRQGTLTVIHPSGRKRTFGDSTGLPVVVRLRGALTPLQLALWPDLHLGEAYVSGALVFEQGTLWNLLDLLGCNLARRQRRQDRWPFSSIKALARCIQQFNPPYLARKHAAHHYDLSFEMYRSFLDRDLQYSCAYFTDDRMSLDEAQDAKKAHIISKLLLRPGQRVLDIGCGWGGLALLLAQGSDVRVTGITLSKEQLAVARARAQSLRLQDRVEFLLQDYREVTGRFDRIVSVGMFEHVGVPHYRKFFARINDLLERDGIALIHAIGRAHGPAVTNAWIRKYIFPGGYIPALSQVLPAVEHASLWITDLEILRLHYADTLRTWRTNFLNRFESDEKLNKRFRRMWEFYLGASEMSFRYSDLMVFQLQLAQDVGSVPRTRNYIYRGECGPNQLRAAE
jgi:cyclopropane-fatty-acyl-phospholipid synthase